MDASQIFRGEDVMLETLRITVVGNARVLHRRVDHNFHSDLELAGAATDRNVGARHSDQVLLGACCVEESHAEQPLRINEQLVGHAASSKGGCASPGSGCNSSE